MFRWRVGGKRINMRKFFYLISSIVLFASCSSVDQIISVFDLIDDTTITAEQLEGPICKMKETIEHVIDTDGNYEFAQMMRATARNIAGRMPVDNRLMSDCVLELMMIDCRWQT